MQSDKPKKILVAGMGPGEISQAMAFVRHAVSVGSNVSLVIFNPAYASIANFTDDNFSLLISDRKVDAFDQVVKSERPDVLVLCNSKMDFPDSDESYFKESPWPWLATISIDSNWLFIRNNPAKTLQWPSAYCINIPEPVFQLGLTKNGGHYDIPKETLGKIKLVGLIPSYERVDDSLIKSTREKLNIQSDEKLVFVYSTSTTMLSENRSTLTRKGIDAVGILRDQGHKIKIVNVGPMPDDVLCANNDWHTNVGEVSTEEFHTLLSSADLVFQHQGLGTLEQAIASNVPVLSNVRDMKDEESPYHAHAWEVLPFVSCGAASMLYFSDSLEKTAAEIASLLYDADKSDFMRRSQSALYVRGEAGVMTVIDDLLASKN